MRLMSAAELSGSYRPDLVRAFGVRLTVPNATSDGAPQWTKSRLTAVACLRPNSDMLDLDTSTDMLDALAKFYSRQEGLALSHFVLDVSTDTQGRVLPVLFLADNFALFPGSALAYGRIPYGRTAGGYMENPAHAVVKWEALYEHLYLLHTLADGPGVLAAVFQYGVVRSREAADDASLYDAREGWWPLMLSMETTENKR